jgi:hypothetical protein
VRSRSCFDCGMQQSLAKMTHCVLFRRWSWRHVRGLVDVKSELLITGSCDKLGNDDVHGDLSVVCHLCKWVAQG